MDEHLAKELEDILNIENKELQEKSMAKIIFYLLTLPPPSAELTGLLKAFTKKAFEILPSSNLPYQLAKNCSFSNMKKKRVSFSSTSFVEIKTTNKLSREGELQKIRESNTLSLNNTDLATKFVPRDGIIQGLSFDRVNVPLLNFSNNKFNPELHQATKKFTKVKIELSQILSDPAVLEIFI